jgi:hypothetical protein
MTCAPSGVSEMNLLCVFVLLQETFHRFPVKFSITQNGASVIDKHICIRLYLHIRCLVY